MLSVESFLFRIFTNYSAALARVKRAQRCTMGNKIWSAMHPRKFGYDVAYARPPTHPYTHFM